MGPLRLHTPVILAPMAGVTDVPFRRLCRLFGEDGLPPAQKRVLDHAVAGVDAPAGLYVCEMITARALVEGNEKTRHMVTPDPAERVRSMQLYGTDPDTMERAARIVAQEDLADHVDLNFGCPVPKVTKQGGGAALPWKRDLFADIVSAVVRGVAGGGRPIPVTVKMRLGIDAEHLTYVDAGRIAQRVGAAAVALHGRTQAQYYSGKADWEPIKRLKDDLSVPVFGNGDIFAAADALSMVEQTGCDAVVVGRGVQGRPWLFKQLVEAFWTGSASGFSEPTLGEVAAVILEHTDLMIANSRGEEDALRKMRKHLGWYLRGFGLGGHMRLALARVSSRAQLVELLDSLDASAPYPPAALGKRGRAGSMRKPHLPYGWLDSTTLDAGERSRVAAAESDDIDGG
ncbi:MAG: tRNA dihydrouridine synthase DusB [Actinomycetaceae bacterium]|nr:tRNA dihydrouridine synthase DusB [Actinomycetaceae bacterium]